MDSYEGNNEDPLSLHKYLYCSGNPVNRIDPSGNMEGLAGVACWMGIGATVGALTSVAANIAMGKATTWTSVLQGAAIGAVLGPGALVPSAALGLGIGGVLVGASYLPILTDPNSTRVQKTAATGLFVASIWGAKAGFDFQRNPGFVQTPDSPTPEPTLMLYHKGELNSGTVGGKPYLSLGIDRASVEAVNRPGKVWTFKVPARLLMRWERDEFMARKLDHDSETGVINNEIRILPPKYPEMNQFLQKD